MAVPIAYDVGVKLILVEEGEREGGGGFDLVYA